MVDSAGSAFGLGLAGKQVAVLGVADETSLAWGIAEAFRQHGAIVTIGYQQRFLSRVKALLRDSPEIRAARCDVTNPAEMEAFFAAFASTRLDVLVHAIAYGPPEVFTSDPSAVSAEAFAQMLRVSAFSLGEVTRYAKPHLAEWGSVIALSYQASLRAQPFYGLMGVAKSALEGMVRYLAVELGQRRVRVNAISPGPVASLAALGIMQALLQDRSTLARQRDRVIREAYETASLRTSAAAEDLELASAIWSELQQGVATRCAIEETISKEDVAGCALFLGSDLARKITGQVVHVDCGLSSTTLM
jgi:enoyl-[acyl-carrier protein] reductase I